MKFFKCGITLFLLIASITKWDIPVMKGRKSFFKLYHLRPFITRDVELYSRPCKCALQCSKSSNHHETI